jgi:hypothetical protein
MSQQPHRRRWLLLVVILLGSLFLGWTMMPPLAIASPPDPVTAAWEQARAAGSYHFAADVTQLTVPVAKVTNVGRTSRTEQLRLEGQSDLRAKTMQMQIWADGGSVVQADGDIAIKMENGKSFVRRGAGEWQEEANGADAFAPQGDFLAYLHAMRDVQAQAPEQRAGIAFTRYSFTIDGPTFAAYVRDQTEQALRAKGELPGDMHLELSAYYREMTGDGELWVGENGLPLRQILNLNFPEQREQTTHAQIVVDFSRFGLSSVQSPQSAVLSRLGWTRDFGLGTLDYTPLLIFLTTLTFALVVLYYRRSRVVYTGLVTAIIVSMVIGPLLTTLKVEAFFAAQSAKAAAQAEQQATTVATQEASAAFGRPEFNPNVNPLESVTHPVEANPQSPVATFQAAPVTQLTDNGADTDNDGLTDFVEARVGTDATVADTDDDGIRDAQEVYGFPLGGQNWYANALSIDSNNDGISDGQEWGFDANNNPRQPPQDTDGDNLPDLFDPDNDNDGVFDRQDLAPFTVSPATFSEANPLKLTLNNLTAGKPTLVDFQVRPTDAGHLWYAFNVLDWPRNDNAGQVQDIDSKTYADLAASQGRVAAPNEALGDMKLVPMLEIRLPNTNANLPPQSDLTPYNISVNPLDATTNVVYLALSVITDEQTGQRLAFSGRMRYLPSGAWPAPHDVRLAWVVQVLTDVPCDHTDPQDVAVGCASDDYIHNVPQVVQSYYDNFTLTGLNVSEEHGAKTALIYEDPAVDPNRKDNVSLAALSLGLDQSFLTARDADKNGVRDVDINEIARRFERTTNSSVPAEQRWGLDGVNNNLRVERHDYPTFDQAAIFTAMTDTVKILNSQFTPAWGSDNTLKPTLAYAYEQQARSLGLDATKTSGGYVTLTSTGVTVDMQPTEQPRAALATMVGFKWSHYCRANSSAPWSACAADDYWLELESRYGSRLLTDEPNDPALNAGSNAILQIHNLTLSQGINVVVQNDNVLVSSLYSLQSDSQIEGDVRSGLTFGAAAVKKMANLIIMDYYLNNAADKKQLGQSVVDFLEGSRSRKLINAFKKTSRLKGTATGLRAAVFVAGMSLIAYQAEQSAGNNLGKRIAIRTLVVGVQSYAALVDPVLTVLRWAREGKSIADLLRSSTTKAGTSRTATAIGAVIAVGVVWGFFIYSMVSNKVSAFSPDFNKALAETIAATLYIVIVALISATVVGLIIVGIVAVIDAILTAICEMGVDELRSNTFYGGACFTLGTTATKFIAYFLYNYDLMINTGRSDLVAPGAPNTQLANPAKGFVTGNELSITMPITTHVVHKDPDPASGLYINLYLYYFSADNLRSSTFKYSLTQPNPQDITGIARGDMRNEWQRVGEDHKYVATPMYGGYATTTPPRVTGFNLQPGLNRSASFYLNMGYAVPAYECWGIPLLPFYNVVVPVCYTRTFQGKNSTKLDALRYDIFPATVDGFMTLGAKSDGGRGLSWDAAFPGVRDSDNDGLLATAFGGLDPNDATWDNDGDGLSDSYEMERRSAGRPYSPIQCDSDNDGLSDGQEAQFGANLGIADTDNDGLKDGEEVWHRGFTATTCQPTNSWSGGWDITINGATPFALRVSSDPTVDDSDGDGVSDLAEKQLAQKANPAERVDRQNIPYNPIVVNTPPISIYTTATKRIVAPGQSLVYTTTVIARTALAPSVLDVTAPAVLGVSPAPYALAFNTTQTVTQQTNFTAQPGSATQVATVVSTVRSRLASTQTATLQWDPFTFQSLGNPGQLNRLVRVAASAPDRQDSYQVATAASSLTTRGGDGSVLGTLIPGGVASTLFTTNASQKMGDNPPDVACNNSGICLVLYEDRLFSGSTVLADRVFGYTIGADGQRSQPLFLPSITPSGNRFNPQVASDGVNFLVVHEKATGPAASAQSYIEWALYSPTLTTLINSGQVHIEPTRTWPLTTAGVGLDVAWIGSRYRVGWKFLRNSGTYPLVNFGDIDQNGVLVNPATPFQSVTALEPDNDSDGTPALAYDPVGGRTLALFKGPNGDTAYILWPNTDIQNRTAANLPNTDPTTNFRYLQSERTPGVAYNPMVNGWLINARGRSHLFKLDLSTTLLPMQTVIANGNIPLACPAASALPVADLRFEELPGATTFVDSSGRNNNATCANCPTAGVVGAVDSSGIAVGGGAQGPSSDYAVAFTGDFAQGIQLPTPTSAQNHFSFAFWYKSPASTNPDSFSLADSTANAFLSFNIFGSYLEFKSGATSFRADRNINDGAWHFVVATRDDASGRMAIYLDGNPTPVATLATSNRPFTQSTLWLRSRRPATIDHFRIYALPLSGAAVQALYNRTLQSYCVGVAGSQSNGSFSYQWAKLNASVPDTRGGKITASKGLTITIDADKPTSSISGWRNDQYILGNTVHTIGGTASDALSGIAKVEIDARSPLASANFQPASGAESWAYNLAVTEGTYRLQSRATDGVGNVETPPANAFIFVYADATRPNVTLNTIPAAATLPTRNGANLWITPLSGTVVDPTSNGVASGLRANAVEVLLQGAGDALGNGWQTATLTGNTWSLNYTFAPGVQEPTGSYTVSVRATDFVGNRTADNAATGILRLDTTGPAAALSTVDATRSVITSTITLSGVLTDTGTAGVDKLEVAFVTVNQIAALPTDISAAQADAQLNRTWLPATVTQRGAVVSTWSLPLPFPLENEYQIDLRATDKLGNVLRSDNAWRGIIDTVAPRMAVDAAKGPPWFNATLGRTMFDLSLRCGAVDRYIKEDTFQCPAGGAPVRTIDNDPNLQALFPDRTIVSGLSNSASYPYDDPNVGVVFTSCDGYGHCNQVIARPGACYWIENAATGYVLDINGANPAQGTQVIVWPKNVPTSNNQLWQLNGDGSIQSKLNGYVLDINGANTAPGTKVIMWPKNTPVSSNQYWDRMLQGQGAIPIGGDITIMSRLQNFVLDTQNASTALGTPVVVQPQANPIPSNQRWRLVQAPAASCGSATVAVANTVTAATVNEATATNAAPTVIVLTPGEGNTVDARGNVQMSVAAQADQRLKELIFLLDNTPVKTITFAQSAAVTRTVQTVAITVATAGRHTLTARATDWSGAQSAMATVAFVADRQPPTVSLAQTVVTKADSYGAQSNILRFRGAANDDVKLVAVQLKVGDQPYANASFGGTASASGNWRIAYPVSDPEGKQLAVKVRALDAAGNVTEISQILGTDLSAADAPDTTLGEKPADPSSSTSANFSFTGSATAVAFECQLDDAPAVPCTSPWALSDLSNGSHTFKVTAVNDQGFPDLTPASHTWTVNVTALATTLTAQPEAATTSRTASFSFTASGANSFECALDNGKYAACTSPKSYDKLGNGQHTFLVRATGGPATRYVWRVTNAAPTVTGDQVIMVAENSAVNVTLQGADSDALTYQIIEQPQHGLLLGLAPKLTYVPNTGYAGPDRFTYRAWDGEAASAPATVHITVRLGKYAVFAQEGVAFEQNSAIVRGDVGVNVKSAGPFLRDNVEASFRQNAKMQDPASRVLADSIVVDNNGVIYNPSYNDLTGKGNVLGTRTTPLVLPLRSGLPALPTITPGAQAVTVNGNQTLAAGSYGALTVNNGATLVLSGGLYHFASWNVGPGAKVHFQGPSEVRMAGALLVNQNGFVGPMPGVANLDANSIVIHVAGTGGQSGPGNQPRSAAIEQNATITAYIVAPNGMINFRQNVNATGAFIAKWVLAEQNAKVTRPGDPVVRAADVDSVVAETPAITTTPTITTTSATTTAVESTLSALFLPLVNAGGAPASDAMISEAIDSEAVDNPTVVTETVGSDTLVVEITPLLTPTRPLTTTPVLTTTALVTTTALTTTVPVTAPTTAAANQPAPKTLVYLPVVAR